MLKKHGLRGLLSLVGLAGVAVAGAALLSAPAVKTGTLAESAVVRTRPAGDPVTSAAPKASAHGTIHLSRSPHPHARHKPAARKAKPKPAPAPPATLDFVISSFNMLGDSHTKPGGTHADYASGSVRARWAADLLARHSVDVVGFQELQDPQLAALMRTAGAEYDVYPGTSLGARGTENSIGWRTDMWEPVRRTTVQIPYFDGNERPMPVVLLRSRSTGLEAWFANFHNPADVRRFPNQQHWRDLATAREISLAERLMRDDNVPVFFTGDMNERAEYFCRFTGATGMVAARGGSNAGGACRPDSPRAVDWIFGSRDVRFSGYTEDRSPLVQRTTDHPMISSGARISGHPSG